MRCGIKGLLISLCFTVFSASVRGQQLSCHNEDAFQEARNIALRAALHPFFLPDDRDQKEAQKFAQLRPSDLQIVNIVTGDLQPQSVHCSVDIRATDNFHLWVRYYITRPKAPESGLAIIFGYQ